MVSNAVGFARRDRQRLPPGVGRLRGGRRAPATTPRARAALMGQHVDPAQLARAAQGALPAPRRVLRAPRRVRLRQPRHGAGCRAPPAPSGAGRLACRRRAVRAAARRPTAGSLGLLSLDEPPTAAAPSDGALDGARGGRRDAASAIEHGQHAAEAARHRAAVEHLLRVSAELTTQLARTEMLGAVCEGIRDALGFEKAAVFLDEEGDGRLVPAASVGFDDSSGLGALHRGRARAMMAPEIEREGCVLLDSATRAARWPSSSASRPSTRRHSNGRGAARLGPPLAAGAAARPRRRAARLHLGRRSGRPAAAGRRRAARAARVRQPGGRARSRPRASSSACASWPTTTR